MTNCASDRYFHFEIEDTAENRALIQAATNEVCTRNNSLVVLEMKPSEKWPAIENFLESMSGRKRAITHNVCIPSPLGCGANINNLEEYTEIEKKEYTISGLCKECQERIFG